MCTSVGFTGKRFSCIACKSARSKGFDLQHGIVLINYTLITIMPCILHIMQKLACMGSVKILFLS